MNKKTILLSGLLFAVLGEAPAAVTHRWQVDDSQITPVSIRAYHGETLSLEARLTSYGVPVTNVTTATFLWQTNGMASAWWQTNATFAVGIARATFTPAMSPGASQVRFFFSMTDETGGSYRPAGSIQFLPSPGATPSVTPLPSPGSTLDLSQVTVLNAPWCTLEAAQSAVSTGVNAALNAVSTLSNEVSTTYAKRSDIPMVPSLDNYATIQTVSNSAASVLLAAEQSAASTYQPLASMSAYALKTEMPTVPSLAPYATIQALSNSSASVLLAAEQSAAATYQPLSSMPNYATKADLESAVIGAGSSDYTLRLLSPDGSRFQTSDGSVYKISLSPAVTNWYDVNWPNDMFVYQSDNTWTNGDNILRWVASSNIWEHYNLSQLMLYQANPSAGFAATNITLHATETRPGWVFSDVVMQRSVIPPHPVTNKIDQVLYQSTGSQGDLIAATNATLNAAKAYTDEQIEGAGSVTPSSVSNIVNSVAAGKLDAWNEDHTQHVYWEGNLLNFSYGISVNASPTMFPADLNGFYFGDTTMQELLDAKANVDDAYPATSGNQLASQVSTIGAHLNAEDARFVSTNYNSATHMPEAYVEIKLTNNTWSTIWREMTRFNWLTNTYLPTNYASKAELDEKADRAWGYYDSHTGSYAPDGYTWISSPRIAIAAGLAYQRTVTSEGAVWVLESNGLVTQTGGETNGFLRITDEDGNTQFEIVKGNKRTIGADASSCQVVAGFSPTKLQIGYSISSDTHPTIEVTGSLSSPSWKSETDADCLANVTWSGASGAYVAQVQAKTAQPSLFVRATYQTGGETYINNAAPVALNYLYLGGVKYAVSTNTISGHLVLTLTPSL